MMKKNWKNRSAVSPVIATILMVAITVVLAAVLYVMVMGFGTGPQNSPTASMTATTTNTAHTEQITIAAISSPQTYANMKLSLVVGNTAYTITAANGLLANAGWSTALPGTLTVNYVSVGGTGSISSGDYVLIKDTTTTDTLTLNLLYGSSATSIASTSWNAF